MTPPMKLAFRKAAWTGLLPMAVLSGIAVVLDSKKVAVGSRGAVAGYRLHDRLSGQPGRDAGARAPPCRGARARADRSCPDGAGRGGRRATKPSPDGRRVRAHDSDTRVGGRHGDHHCHRDPRRDCLLGSPAPLEVEAIGASLRRRRVGRRLSQPGGHLSGCCSGDQPTLLGMPMVRGER